MERQTVRCHVRFGTFVQLKKHENHPRRSAAFGKNAGLSLQLYFTKSSTLPWVFFTFFKLCKWYQIAQRVSYNQFLNLRNIESVIRTRHDAKPRPNKL